MTNADRAVRALNDMTWAVAPGECDLPAAAALVIRVVRDDLMLACQAGEVGNVAEVVDWLHTRVGALTGRTGLVGDTTEAAEPEPELSTAVIRPVLDQDGRMSPEVTVSVGEWTWPVPGQPGTQWRDPVDQTLRDHGWTLAGSATPAGGPGAYEVLVRKIETNRT